MTVQTTPVVALKHYPPPQYLTWPLTADAKVGTFPAAVREARSFVLATLEKWGMASIADTAVIVASELVTNAVKASWPEYIGEPITAWLFSDGSDVVIEVWDGSPDVPVQVPVSETAQDGRGLAIVASFSQSWGWYPERLGKIVWALLSGGE